jgi:retron-type reverse transcriptase
MTENIFENICSFSNIHDSYARARSGKRYRQEVLAFNAKAEENLLNIKTELSRQQYQHGSYREFIVCDSKKRHIKAAPFKDRIVHHAICHVMGPIFEKGFIYDSYACRTGKGTHRAIKKVQNFITSAKAKKDKTLVNQHIYCLQCDISKYFDSVDHNILLEIMGRKIKDKKSRELLRIIVESSGAGKGIPIGNLTSQLFANVYLNEFDQFVKREMGAKYYIRYMADFLNFGFDKKSLHLVQGRVKNFLESRLRLKLHPKKVNIYPLDKGIDFLGYVIFEKHKLLRKSTVKRFIRRTKVYQRKLSQEKMSYDEIIMSTRSWVAYAKYANSYKLRKQLGKRLSLYLY